MRKWLVTVPAGVVAVLILTMNPAGAVSASWREPAAAQLRTRGRAFWRSGAGGAVGLGTFAGPDAGREPGPASYLAHPVSAGRLGIGPASHRARTALRVFRRCIKDPLCGVRAVPESASMSHPNFAQEPPPAELSWQSSRLANGKPECPPLRVLPPPPTRPGRWSCSYDRRSEASCARQRLVRLPCSKSPPV